MIGENGVDFYALKHSRISLENYQMKLFNVSLNSTSAYNRSKQ